MAAVQSEAARWRPEAVPTSAAGQLYDATFVCLQMRDADAARKPLVTRYRLTRHPPLVAADVPCSQPPARLSPLFPAAQAAAAAKAHLDTLVERLGQIASDLARINGTAQQLGIPAEALPPDVDDPGGTKPLPLPAQGPLVITPQPLLPVGHTHYLYPHHKPQSRQASGAAVGGTFQHSRPPAAAPAAAHGAPRLAATR